MFRPEKIDYGDYSSLDRLVYMVITYGIAKEYLTYIKLATKLGNVMALDYYYGMKSQQIRAARKKRRKRELMILVVMAAVVIGVMVMYASNLWNNERIPFYGRSFSCFVELTNKVFINYLYRSVKS